MNDVQAAMGLSQMDKVDALLERRAHIAARLRERLAGSPYVELPAPRAGNEHTWHLYVIRLNLDRLRIDRDHFIRALTGENIGSSVHFIPIYEHAFFAPFRRAGRSYPECDEYFSRCVSLPIYPGMSDADADDVAEAVIKIARYYRAD
jgi:dTDP-4-amino-4,6-dideoxygalactose transaminase